MAYASPRGIRRRKMADSVTRKRKLRGIVKHRDDRDAYEFSKRPKAKRSGFLERLQKFLGLGSGSGVTK